jgi:hypothetical protein
MPEASTEVIIMLGFKFLGAFIILAILATASPLRYVPLFVNPSYQTYYSELYLQGPRLNAGDYRVDVQGPQFTVGTQIAIVAIHATVSALPDVHVQIWLEIEGQGNFFHVNSGSLGTANSDLAGLYIIVPANKAVILFWWADNLSTSQRDFHASVTVFYQTA